MKLVFIISFGLLCFAMKFEGEVTSPQQIGAACQSEDIFQISSYESSSWPPVAGGKLTLTIQGAYSLAESVSQIQHVFSNGNLRVYEGILINKGYPRGARETYSSEIAIPQPSGSWNVTTLMYDSNFLNVLSCWKFNFNI
ncbi:hypothetical protein SteCoe_8267 [Stentor coeruleus]|uniref:Reelin domain-containing protein n=1 Tax=Stentor coeruleus TaxID=5963 RepID=A0A1R2CKL7_9CILI|nr:hypothetical protein SteCoe_8267 [Stentor coeruleus]